MKSLIGRRFGKLKVVALHGVDSTRNRKWTCLCDCGIHSNVSTNNLLAGRAHSCGCGMIRQGEKIAWNGKKLSLREWARETNLSIATLFYRRKNGVNPPELFAARGKQGRHAK